MITYKSAMLEMPEMFFSPQNHTMSVFLFIFRIYTLFGHIKNKFICFVHLFWCLKSHSLPNTNPKFQLEFPKKYLSNGTGYQFTPSMMLLLYFLSSFFALFLFFIVLLLHGWLNSPYSVHPKVIFIPFHSLYLGK